MAKTKIDWCDEVWNPVTGCTKVFEGCQNCYAEKMAKRLQKMGIEKYRNGFQCTCHESELHRVFSGKGKKIFVNSMSDLFHPNVSEDFIKQVLLHICIYNEHTYIILTKRPERMRYIFEQFGKVIPNIWLGVSVENQKAANLRIPVLLATPAALRFVSVEPMLEEIDLRNLNASGWWMDSLKGITSNTISNRCPMETKLDWVICGCESGPGRRLFNSDWAVKLKVQCICTNTPFFLKQIDIDGEIVEMPELDGEVWNQFPEGKQQC